GASCGARADDERLRGAPQGLGPRLRADGRRAHQTDADFRGEHRKLGRARRALCRALPGAVAAARGGRPSSRSAMELARVMTAMLEVHDLHLSRGERRVLQGVSFSLTRGGLVALMGPSGSGKTTILRAIAALERFERGTIRIEGVTMTGDRRLDLSSLRELR